MPRCRLALVLILATLLTGCTDAEPPLALGTQERDPGVGWLSLLPQR
jgi:hypothetical protein